MLLRPHRIEHRGDIFLSPPSRWLRPQPPKRRSLTAGSGQALEDGETNRKVNRVQKEEKPAPQKDMPSVEQIIAEIFECLKTTPNQDDVTYEEVLSVLQRLLHDVIKPETVDEVLSAFMIEHGLISELSRFNLQEFSSLFERLLNDLICTMDLNGDQAISKKEFYKNMKNVAGWQTWFMKKHIYATFENALREGDTDGDKNLDKAELIVLIHRIVVGEIPPAQILSLPKSYRK